MIKIISIAAADGQRTEKSDQLRRLQESFLLQLVREEWGSLKAVKERLCQLHLAPLARDGVKLQYAAVQIELPANVAGVTNGMQARLSTDFQSLCREAAGCKKHIYPFCDAVSPLLMHFLILSKEGGGKPERWIIELQQHLESVLELKSTAAAGMEVKGVKRMKKAFACSMLSLYRSGWTENGGSVNFPGIPAELEHSLVQCLETPDRSGFERELDVLMAMSEKEAASLDAALYHAQLLLLSLTAIAGKYECSGTALLKYLWNSRIQLAACSSRSELRNRLMEFGELVMRDVELARHSGGRYFAEAVRKYIDRNYGCELSMSSVALMYGVDEASLSRQFKLHVGISPGDYITRIRMAKAEQLLQDCALKLSELSALVGCPSVSHFASSFKKYSGISPKEYRVRVLKNH